MPSTYSCRTCGSSFSSGRSNWASPICGSGEMVARAEQRREGLAAARAASVPSASRRGQLYPDSSPRPSRSAVGRLRVQPTVPPPPPSSIYLDQAHESGSTLPSSAAAARLAPLVVVLSPSYTLLCRPSSSSARVVVRPYLSTFFTYLCRRSHAVPEHAPEREVRLVIFSAMRVTNLAIMLRAIGLERVASMAGPGEGAPLDENLAVDSANDKPLLDLILSRESMGLDKVDFERDVVTVKDLAIVWRELGLDAVEGMRTTILVDESVQAAFPQPHSRLPIAPFDVADVGSTIKSARVRELAGSSSDDTALLTTIYYLELLGRETNVSAALKGGLVRRAEEDARREVRESNARGEGSEVSLYEVQDELARRGRAVCVEYGVTISREWDGEWSEKVRKAARGAQPCAGAVPEL